MTSNCPLGELQNPAYSPAACLHLLPAFDISEKQIPATDGCGDLCVYGLAESDRLIVFGLDFEITLRMSADGAQFGSLLAYDDMAAVAALPDAVALAREHYLVGNVLQ